MPALTSTFIRKATCPPDRSSIDYPHGGSPGLRLRVYPSGRKSWVYRYSLPGETKQREMKLGEYGDGGMELTDAMRDWQRFRELKNRGEDPRSVQGAENAEKVAEEQARKAAELRERFTFATLAETYLDAVSDERSESFKRSWREDARILRRYFVPQLGRLSALAIDRGQLEPVLLRLRAEGKRVQANRCLATVRGMYRWASRDPGLPVSGDPTAGLRATRERPKERVLSDAEVRALLSVLDSSEPHRALRMILLTAQRPGEVVAMQAEAVREGVWRIEATKNDDAQAVYLSAPALDLVGSKRKGPVFPASTSTGAVRVDRLSKLTRDLAPVAGIDPFTPHDLRRTAATWLGERLCPDRVVRRILNHREQGVTAVYQRARLNDAAREWWAKWGEHVAALEVPNVEPLGRGRSREESA